LLRGLDLSNIADDKEARKLSFGGISTFNYEQTGMCFIVC